MEDREPYEPDPGFMGVSVEVAFFTKICYNS